MQFENQAGKAGRHAHMPHKATKWRIMKVLTGPAMRPSCETASKIYTILSKGFSFVKNQCNDE